jgi:hypothetical protein
VIEAQTLDGQTDFPNSRRIASKLGLRVDNANLHAPSMTWASVQECRWSLCPAMRSSTVTLDDVRSLIEEPSRPSLRRTGVT